MASRAEQKAAARAAREAQQKQLNAAQLRRQRVTWLGGLVALAAVAVIVIALTSGGSTPKTSPTSKAGRAGVLALLNGIPQSGTTLGRASAPVTITEYGDLVCPVCQAFALTSEPQLITSDVRTGKVKLVFRGFETASATANPGEYAASQIAARAAGLQGKAWYYILLWYAQQGDEAQPYVTEAYMQGRASQIPGLNLTKWQSDRNLPALASAVTADTSAANAAGVTGTPAIFVSGPKGTQQFSDPSSAVPTITQLDALIKQVS